MFHRSLTSIASRGIIACLNLPSPLVSLVPVVWQLRLRGVVLRVAWCPSSRYLASDPSLDARQAFADQVAGVDVFDTSEPILVRADIIVLAIKPQVMAIVLEDLGSQVSEHQLVVSIAAGVTIKKLAEALPAARGLFA